MNTEELIVNEEVETIQPVLQEKPKCNPKNCMTLCNIIALAVVIIAVGVLYYLHFSTPKMQIYVPKEIVAEPGSGEIVFVNSDIINEEYELVTILTGDIKAETKRQEVIFTNREKTFEKKYTQFQENMNAGVLTQVQAENTQMQLAQEYQLLETDKERVFNDLQGRQAAAILQIYDSLKVAVQRVNAVRKASYVLIYQDQSPVLLHSDPTKDITDQVLFELNRSFKK
jgi:outer membrane protein